MAEIGVTRRADGTTVPAMVGDSIVISLAENPTTGHRWQVDAIDDRILRVRDSRFVGPPNDRPGTPGQRVLTFDVTGPGAGGLSLGLRRRWAPDDAHGMAAERFDLDVNVGG